MEHLDTAMTGNSTNDGTNVSLAVGLPLLHVAGQNDPLLDLALVVTAVAVLVGGVAEVAWYLRRRASADRESTSD